MLAAYAVHVLVAAARRPAQGESAGLAGRARAALVVALLAPLAWPCAEGLLKHQVAPIVELEAGPGLAHRRDLLDLCRWMREAARGQCPPPRTAWYVGYGRNEYASAPVFCGLPQVIDTPAETFAIRPGGISEREVRAFGVRWVVGDRPIEGREGYLEPVRTFGGLHVYEVRDFVSRRVTSLGRARVELLRFEDELIRLRVSGAAPGDRLAVHVSRHPGWVATQEGRGLPVAGGHLGLPRADLIHLPASDGVIELRYTRPASYLVGALIALFAALGLGLLALSGQVLPLLARNRAWGGVLRRARRLPGPVRALAAAALLALLVAGPLALGRGHEAGSEEEAPARATGELLVDRLDGASVRSMLAGQEERVARRWDGRFGALLPPRVLVDRHVEALDLGNPRRVIAVRPEVGEGVALSFDIGLLRGVRGFIARGGRGRERTSVAVRVGRVDLGRAEAAELGRWAEVALVAERPESRLELVVTTEGPPGRAALLDLAIVR